MSWSALKYTVRAMFKNWSGTHQPAFAKLCCPHPHQDPNFVRARHFDGPFSSMGVGTLGTVSMESETAQDCSSISHERLLAPLPPPTLSRKRGQKQQLPAVLAIEGPSRELKFGIRLATSPCSR
eukprot:5001896-Amphidinium_carterae.2